MKSRNINSLKHCIRVACQGMPMAEAGQIACTALFEGLSPVNKARRAIRNILPVPPGGWDSPAQTPEGNDVVSLNGNVLSWNMKMEAFIRDEFFHSGEVAPKFEPGVARMAYRDLHLWPEDVADFRQQRPAARTDRIPSLKAILRMLTGAHQEDFDGDLNGLSFDELERNYGTHRNRNSDDYNEGSGMVDTGESRYRIVHVKNFNESQQFADYFPDNSTRWCICRKKHYWNQYTRKGQNTAYFLISPDAEDIPAVPGENCPLDRYGLSMIGIMIDPDGGLDHCCCRWNYAHGATDGILNRKQIEELIGRPLDKACPHLEPDGSGTFTISHVLERIARGMDPREAWKSCGYKLTERTVFAGAALVATHSHDDEEDDDTYYAFVNAFDFKPVTETEFTSYHEIDEKVLWGTYKSDETDEYGEDVYTDVLLGKDGGFIELATTDEAIAEYVKFYEGRVDSISAIDGLPGIYLLELDTHRGYDVNFPCTLIDSSGSSIVGMHNNIDVYPRSRLICCDLDSDYVCDGDYGIDGGTAVYRYDESGNRKELIGDNSTSEKLDFIGYTAFKVPANPESHDDKLVEDINILYVDDGTAYTIIGGEEKMLFAETVLETREVVIKGTTDTIYRITREIPADVSEEEDEEDVLYDINQNRIIATGLKNMDDSGMYTDSEGLRNQYGINGPMLKKGYRHIDPVYVGKDCPAGNDFFKCKDSPDAPGAIFIDQDTREPVYDHPIPETAIPVTKDLYIDRLPTETDEYNRKYAYFSAHDGHRTSEPFDSVCILGYGTACSMVNVEGDGKEKDKYKRIIDFATGKEYPFTIKDLSVTFEINCPGIKEKCRKRFSEVTGLPEDAPKTDIYIYILSNAMDDTRTMAACCRGVWVFSDIGWKNNLGYSRHTSLVQWTDPDTGRYIVHDMSTGREIDFNSPHNATFYLARFLESQGMKITGENFNLAAKKYEEDYPGKTWMDWIIDYSQNGGNEYGPR